MKRHALAALLVSSAAFAANAQQAKPEDQIKQRQSAYAVMQHNMSSLAAMVQDKKPYNQDEAIRNAELIAALADYPRHFFTPGTEQGRDTKAKPGIWQNRADFDAKMDKMIAEARKLPQAARGDVASLKKAVSDTGAACKACHDDYRAKQ